MDFESLLSFHMKVDVVKGVGSIISTEESLMVDDIVKVELGANSPDAVSFYGKDESPLLKSIPCSLSDKEKIIFVVNVTEKLPSFLKSRLLANALCGTKCGVVINVSSLYGGVIEPVIRTMGYSAINTNTCNWCIWSIIFILVSKGWYVEEYPKSFSMERAEDGESVYTFLNNAINSIAINVEDITEDNTDYSEFIPPSPPITA